MDLVLGRFGFDVVRFLEQRPEGRKFPSELEIEEAFYKAQASLTDACTALNSGRFPDASGLAKQGIEVLGNLRERLFNAPDFIDVDGLLLQLHLINTRALFHLGHLIDSLREMDTVNQLSGYDLSLLPENTEQFMVVCPLLLNAAQSPKPMDSLKLKEKIEAYIMECKKLAELLMAKKIYYFAILQWEKYIFLSEVLFRMSSKLVTHSAIASACGQTALCSNNIITENPDAILVIGNALLLVDKAMNDWDATDDYEVLKVAVLTKMRCNGNLTVTGRNWMREAMDHLNAAQHLRSLDSELQKLKEQVECVLKTQETPLDCLEDRKTCTQDDIDYDYIKGTMADLKRQGGKRMSHGSRTKKKTSKGKCKVKNIPKEGSSSVSSAVDDEVGASSSASAKQKIPKVKSALASTKIATNIRTPLQAKHSLRKAKEGSLALLNDLQQQYEVKIGCVYCSLPTHCCQHNVILLKDISAQVNKRLLTIRPRPSKYKGGDELCEKFAIHEKCVRRTLCPFPHNDVERVLWKRDQAGEFNLTEFVQDFSRSLLRVTSLVTQLERQYRGKFRYACNECLKRKAFSTCRKQKHKPNCKADHPWEENKVMVFQTSDGENKRYHFISSPEGTTRNVTDVVDERLREQVLGLLGTGVTENDVVEESKRLKQQIQSQERNKALPNRKTKLLEKCADRNGYTSIPSTGNDGSFNNDWLPNTGHITVDTDLDSLDGSDEEVIDNDYEYEILEAQDSNIDMYYNLFSHSELSLRVDKEPDTYRVCVIHLEGTCSAVARPLDNSGDIEIRGRMNCGPCFNGDEVVVEVLQTKELDKESTVTRGRVRGIWSRKSSRYNKLFVCRVGYYCSNLMRPLCGSAPKFHLRDGIVQKNWPKKKNELVVVYDKQGEVKRIVRVDRLQRDQVLFLVKYETWSPKSMYPLGSVRAVIPAGTDYSTSQNVLNRIYHLPKEHAEDYDPKVQIYHKKMMNLERKTRIDLRDLCTFSIDPEDSKDIDDAISIELVTNGRYEVHVHISDVSHYIDQPSDIDSSARQRCFSYYIKGKGAAAPMIPRSLGEGVCSLLQDQERLALSVHMVFDENGEVVSTDVLESVIRNDATITYKKVQAIVDGSTVLVNNVEPKIAQRLTLLKQLATVLRTKRLGVSMFSISMDDTREQEAHYMVEELMLRTNREVAEFLHEHFQDRFPQRSQLKPQESKLQNWLDRFGAIGGMSLFYRDNEINSEHLTVPPKIAILDKVLDICSLRLADDDIKGALQMLGMETLHPAQSLAMVSWYAAQSLAHYNCHSDKNDASHFSLKLPRYVHFTSPIRRYADLITHRLVKKALHNNNLDTYNQIEIDDICAEINVKQANVKKFHKKSELLVAVKPLLDRPCSTVGFIKDIDDGSVTLHFPGFPKINKQYSTVRFPHLGVSSKPLTENDDTVILKWQRKIYDCKTTHPHARVKQNATEIVHLDPGSSIKLVPSLEWRQFIETLESNEERLVKHRITNILDSARQHDSSRYRPEVTSEMKYPDKIVRHHVEFCRKLSRSGVVEIQIAVEPVEGLLQPMPQLLQLTPEVHFCLEHTRNPVRCFSEIASRPAQIKYRNGNEYIETFLPIMSMETATCSLSAADPILVHNVPVVMYITNDTCFGNLTLHKEFCKERHIHAPKASTDDPDDEDERSDFLCIRSRYPNRGETDRSLTNIDRDTWVGHAIAISASLKNETDVNLNFEVHQSSHLRPSHMLQNTNVLCSVEFITKPLPQRRMEEAISNIMEARELCQAIALGRKISATDSVDYKDAQKLPESLDVPWADSKKSLPSNNRSQTGAIRRALSRRFTLIQGPPGTGKTLTGIKLVYWYCHLNKIITKRVGESQQVLYCGPSNSSVDVVTTFLKERLGKLCPKILRVYSDALVNQEFPIPRDSAIYSRQNKNYSLHSLRRHRDVALHHLIRLEGNSHCRKLIDYDILFAKNTKTPENVADEQIDDYRKTVADASVEEIAKYEVILCTCAASASPRLVKHAAVRQIIVDEAGMCMEPETLIPLVSHKPQQVVLIGDHQQLRPIVKNDVAKSLGLEKSLFERYKNDAVPLREQYRMHPGIVEFPAAQFYANVKLQTPLSRAWSSQPLNIWPNIECPIVFCHVEGAEKTQSVSTEDGNEQSKSNEAERDHAVRIFSDMVNLHKVPYRFITVLSQYKAQCSDISKTLVECGYIEPTVNTVVSAQGEEWDYVILSCVRSLPQYEIEKKPSVGWLKRNMGFIIDYHQINVAITRARRGLIILGNKNLLCRDKMWNSLLKHYEERRCVVNATEFPRDVKTRSHIHRNIAINEQRQKYQHFSQQSRQ